MTRNLKEFVNQKANLAAGFEGDGARHVAVLLAHYNGGPLLAEQLESLAAQTHRDWSLILSDDGSTGTWIETVADFTNAHPQRPIWLQNGPRKGFVRNFLSLIEAAGPTVPYAAFCDQDDVWLPGKLSRAVAALERVRPGQAALYCGRTLVCDRDLRPLGPSPLFLRPPSFANALVQNIGGGNTMVLNRAALDVLQDTARHATQVIAHDWWAYQIVTGTGGRVIFDPHPTVLYRQHGLNQIGANATWHARAKRIGLLLRNRYKGWNDAQTAALARAAHWLTPEARSCLKSFEKARTGHIAARITALRQAGVYRQTPEGQCALWLAATLNKL